MDSYWPEGTLADLLDIHVQNYADDFREYWHLDAKTPPDDITADEWNLIRVLDRVGAASLASARSLRVTPELAEIISAYRPGDDVQRTAQDLLNYNVAQGRAEIELASVAIGKLFEGKKRLATIIYLLSQHSLSDRALAYVDRMVQSYIWGLDTECVIMARSMVEAALEDRISEVDLRRAGHAPKRHGFEFWQYTDTARRLSLLDAEALDFVDLVRRAGNEAVHAAPGLHHDAIASIAYAVVLLRTLFPS